MKLKTLINYLKMSLILYLLIVSSAIGQTDSIDYYSKTPLTTEELKQIAKYLLICEDYYYSNSIKAEIIKEQDNVIDSLMSVIEHNQQIQGYYKKIIELKDTQIEEAKPKWWQNQYIIIAQSIIAFIAGVYIAK